MSFVRKGDDSDVYVYESANSLDFVCCVCQLTDKIKSVGNNSWDKGKVYWEHVDTSFENVSDMLLHLKDHKNAGHKVPSRAFENLKERQKEGDNNKNEKKKRRKMGMTLE